MPSGTTYYRITHTSGISTILACSKQDAIERFHARYPGSHIIKVEKR